MTTEFLPSQQLERLLSDLVPAMATQNTQKHTRYVTLAPALPAAKKTPRAAVPLQRSVQFTSKSPQRWEDGIIQYLFYCWSQDPEIQIQRFSVSHYHWASKFRSTVYTAFCTTKLHCHRVQPSCVGFTTSATKHQVPGQAYRNGSKTSQ